MPVRGLHQPCRAPIRAGGGGPVIIYVDASATGAGNGTSWADAHVSLQVALTGAASGSQIWVAEGTCIPGIDRTSTFQLKNGVELYGGFPRGGSTMDSRDPWRYATIMSGEIGDPDIRTDNCHHVLAGTGTDSAAVLDGFQVTAGYANGVGSLRAGGIINNFGSPTMHNVEFLRNYAAGVEGAMANVNGSPMMENVGFRGNQSGIAGGAVDNYHFSNPAIGNALFVANLAPSGAAVYNKDSSTPVLRNATIVSNEADNSGGAIFTDDTSGAAVMNSSLWGNSPDQIHLAAGGTTSAYYTILQGGCPPDLTCEGVVADDPLWVRSPSPGIAVQGDPPPVWGNEDDNYGDLRLEVGSPAIDSGNNAMLKPGLVTDLMGNPRLADSPGDGVRAMGGGGFTVDRGADEAPPMPIYVDEAASGTNDGTTWANAAARTGDQVHLDDTSDLTSNHNLIEYGCPAGATCNDTVKDDPLFYVDPSAGDDGILGTPDDKPGDLGLWKVSPAIDAGDGYAVGWNRWDLVGNPRLVDVAAVADTGVGPDSVPVVDIGAYESPPDVIHVDQAAGGPCSGLSWTDALTDMQDALGWGSSGPTDVWVAQGTYVPGARRSDAFDLVKGVSLYGGFPTGGEDGTFEVRDWRAYTTTLSGEIGLSDHRDDNSYRVLVGRHVDQTVRVDGFVVSGGNAGPVPLLFPVISRCRLDNPHYGGGLCLFDSSPVLTNLTFQDNYAWKGGGAELSQSSRLMANVAFIGNQASHDGGGLDSVGSELTLTNALFVGNLADDGGGAMWNNESSLTILNATLAGNHAGAHVLNSDPAFVRDPDPGGDATWSTADDDLGDLRLQISSPAIDAGDSEAFPSSITTDLMGSLRLVDVPAIPNTGTGGVPIDMGAYEYANAPPTGMDDAYTTPDDAPLKVEAPGVLANDSDPDGDPLTAAKDSDPVSGSLVLKAHGSFLYTPAPDTTGVFTFTYHAHDGTASSNIAAVTITVTAGNVPPTISDIPDQATSPGTPVGPISFTVGDVETPAEALTLSAHPSNPTMAPTEKIAFGGSGANRTVTITPAPGHTGEAIITIIVDDGTESASDTLTLGVESSCYYLPLVVRE